MLSVVEKDQIEPGAVQLGDDVTLFVASGTDPHSASGSIVRHLREGHNVTLRSIGAGAANQAVKALAIARQQFAAKFGGELTMAPGFEMVSIRGEERTAVTWKVVKHDG